MFEDSNNNYMKDSLYAVLQLTSRISCLFLRSKTDTSGIETQTLHLAHLRNSASTSLSASLTFDGLTVRCDLDHASIVLDISNVFVEGQKPSEAPCEAKVA